MDNIKIETILKVGKTTLETDSCWYFFEAVQEEKKVESYVIIPNSLEEAEIYEAICEHIIKIGFENFISLDKIHPYLKGCILECHHSDNEMYFTGDDEEAMNEWNSFSIDEQNSIYDYVRKSILDNYIDFDGDEMTVYGGISSVVNFKE